MEIKIRHVWKQIFSKPFYIAIAVLSALLFYLLNVFILNFSTLSSFTRAYGFSNTIPFFIDLTFGFHNTIEFYSVITLILTSLFLGFLISLISFKTSNLKKKSKAGLLGTTAIFLGILAPGCAACGIGLVSALGLSSIAITFLPFDGLEISLLAITILIFAIFKISKELTVCDICQINLQQLKGGKT